MQINLLSEFLIVKILCVGRCFTLKTDKNDHTFLM